MAAAVARELFYCLPVKNVAVDVRASMVNQSTGHLDPTVILSVRIPRGTAETLNFEKLDPSESMQLFVHTMGFKRTKGFAAVESIAFGEIEL